MQPCESPDTIISKQWLVNDVNEVVNDALVGLVKCNPELAIFDTGPVVVQKNHLDIQKVKIISGGASGHEPCFAGFVGSGMLTASVQGGVYSSPRPNLVLRTIKELARRHAQGILIIIGNHLSDRLSFGLAVERAKNIPNLKIRILQVADECSNSFERQTLVGILLIQKIAGAMAEAGLYLYEIHDFCKMLLEYMSTVLVCLKPTISPYIEVSSCATIPNPAEMEFGAGLHGQPGYMKISLKSARETVKLLLQHITDETKINHIELDPRIPVVVFVNNLGHSSKLEEHVFLKEIITQLQEENITIAKLYCNTLMTAFDMTGFSLTILKVIKSEILDYLNAPCSAPYWKFFSQAVVPLDTNIILNTDFTLKELQLKPKRGPRLSNTYVNMLSNCLSYACGVLTACEKQLNIIDSETGDSDTGTNMKRGAAKLVEYLQRGSLEIEWPFMLLEQLSKILETHCTGLLCYLFAIMFEAAAQPLFALEETVEIDFNTTLLCFQSAVDSVGRYGRIVYGQRTMYDPLCKMMEAFRNSLSVEMEMLDVFGFATTAAEEAAAKTRCDDKKHPDPGAHAVGLIMRAIYEALKLEPVLVKSQDEEL